MAGSFHFTISAGGVTINLSVPVGQCSAPETVPAGKATVTEAAVPFYHFVSAAGNGSTLRSTSTTNPATYSPSRLRVLSLAETSPNPVRATRREWLGVSVLGRAIALLGFIVGASECRTSPHSSSRNESCSIKVLDIGAC